MWQIKVVSLVSSRVVRTVGGLESMEAVYRWLDVLHDWYASGYDVCVERV